MLRTIQDDEIHPVIAFVWKGSKTASRVDEHEKDLKEMQGKIEHEKHFNYNHRIVIFLTIKKNRYILKT